MKLYKFYFRTVEGTEYEVVLPGEDLEERTRKVVDFLEKEEPDTEILKVELLEE